MKRNQIIRYSIISLLILAVLVGGYFYFQRADRNPLDKYFTVKADRGSVRGKGEMVR